MFVMKNITNDIYKKLMNYAFQTCDFVLVTKYNDQWETRNKRILGRIQSKGYSEETLLDFYKSDSLDSIYDVFVNDNYIFDDEYVSRENERKRLVGNSPLFDANQDRRKYIRNAVLCFLYDYFTNLWLNKYRKNIVFNKENILKNEPLGKEIFVSTIYYIKLDSELKNDILSRKDLFEDWCFPNSIEDLSFFKDGYCWLFSISHEEICEIYCRDEEEYNYLKAIGVEFAEEQFVSTPKEELYYENYLKVSQ